MDSSVKWIGNCNELNAGYAADGYARMKGLGALCTTYGVGELNAMNAIAGCYAEQIRLSHEKTAARLFDDAIAASLAQKGPVYVSLPSDMAESKVHSDPLEEEIPLDHSFAGPYSSEGLLKVTLRSLSNSRRPLIMVDGVSDRFQLRHEINELIRTTDIPTVCLQHGVDIVESSLPNYYGVYTGSLASPELKEYVDSSDFALLLCPLLSDTGTAGWTAVPNMKKTTWVGGNPVTYDDHSYTMAAKDLLAELLNSLELDGLKWENLPPLPKQFAPASAALILSSDSLITQDYFWPRLSSFFQSGDTILLANGTPLIGSKLFDLPPKVRVIVSGLWYSVGHMLPAAQGAALALHDRPRSPDWSGRIILLEGDGSFQVTAQELSRIIRYKLEGYAYERLIEGPEDDYNDVAGWSYTLAPEMMGAMSLPDYAVQVFTAENVGEMETILVNEDVKVGKGLTLVDVKMGRQDVPEYFRSALSMAGKRLRGQ